MNNWIEDVKAFEKKFGYLIQTKPNIPRREEKDFRLDLIREEMRELEHAMHRETLPEVADGIVDAIYVLISTAFTYGIDLGPIWEAVHKANMAKQQSVDNITKVVEPEDWVHPDIDSLINDQIRHANSAVYQLAKQMNLLQVHDEDIIDAWIDGVFVNNSKATKDKAEGFLCGQVIKLSNQRANPKIVKKLIQERLK